MGSTNVISIDSVMNHLKELFLIQSTGGTSSSVSSNPTQSAYVLSMQSLDDLNGNQQIGGNKKKGRNNHKGGKNNNKPKDNGYNEKTNKNVG